ncbi:MAG: type II toxin-antitoxin system HicA family toxin [Hyphomicrobiaceae bacterium]|nr:type II toxin-antitoxin system HicA family toxin [Hyphomicrobiaceae bacterium]
MSERLPSVRAAEVIRALERAGFVVARTRGSHCVLAHRDDASRTLVVPLHGTSDLKPGTLRGIIRQAGLTVAEFRELL